jgi:hypothetical protein
MLYINDQLLNLNDNTNPAVKFYQEKAKEIRGLTDYVVVKKYNTDSPLLKDDKGVKLRPSFTTIPCRWTLKSERGVEQWRYAESRTPRGNDLWNYQPKHWFVNYDLAIDPNNDTEKAFFLMHVVDVGKCGCYVYNPVDEAKEKIAKLGGGDQLDVQYLIFKDRNLTDADRIMLATAWGIQKAETLQMDILKSRLWDEVERGQRQSEKGLRGFRQFINDATEMGTKVQRRAIAQKAIHDGIIRFDSNQSAWLYAGNNEVVCRVDKRQVEKKFEILMTYFANHETELENLGLDVGVDRIKKYSIADIDGLQDMKEIRKAARDLKVGLSPKDSEAIAKERIVKFLSS